MKYNFKIKEKFHNIKEFQNNLIKQFLIFFLIVFNYSKRFRLKFKLNFYLYYYFIIWYIKKILSIYQNFNFFNIVINFYIRIFIKL